MTFLHCVFALCCCNKPHWMWSIWRVCNLFCFCQYFGSRLQQKCFKKSSYVSEPHIPNWSGLVNDSNPILQTRSKHSWRSINNYQTENKQSKTLLLCKMLINKIILANCDFVHCSVYITLGAALNRLSTSPCQALRHTQQTRILTLHQKITCLFNSFLNFDYSELFIYEVCFLWRFGIRISGMSFCKSIFVMFVITRDCYTVNQRINRPA